MNQAMDYWQALASALWGRELISFPLLREGAEGTNLRISLFTTPILASEGRVEGDWSEFDRFDRALAAHLKAE